MNSILDTLLKDMLPTTWLRLIAGSIVPLLGFAWAIPKLLEEIGLKVTPEQKPLLLGTLIVSVVLLWLIVLLVCVVLQHRSSRLASEQFTEYRGAFFKRKPDGTFHEAVYCGTCKNSTTTVSGEPYTNEPFICKCGWRSSFSLGDFNAFFHTFKP